MKRILVIYIFLSIINLSLHGQKALSLDGDLSSKIEETKDSFKEVQRKIRDKKKYIKDIKVDEVSILNQLDRIEREKEETQERMRLLNKRIKRLNGEIGFLKREISTYEEYLHNHESLVIERLKELYKTRDLTILKVLLTVGGGGDLLRRARLITSMVRYDYSIIAEYEGHLEILKRKRNKIEEKKQGVMRMREEIRRGRGLVEEQIKAKRNLLDTIRREKRLHTKALLELEGASKELEDLIGRLNQEERPKVEGFVSKKGLLPWPTEGKIISHFGKHKDPRFHTLTYNKGIEIRARYGEKVIAVNSGTIIFARWFKGYGNLMIIDHGNHFYTLYAHLAFIFKETGEKVKDGETIGTVGDTGSIKGTILYFEIREGGQPRDPIEWLRKR